jgi:hypothetical protein
MVIPGTYRQADGSAVLFADAVHAWATAAMPALAQTAQTYNGVITYAELGEEVQERTGIRTRMLLMNWIGQVLEEVAPECERRGELLLTALCCGPTEPLETATPEQSADTLAAFPMTRSCTQRTSAYSATGSTRAIFPPTVAMPG